MQPNAGREIFKSLLIVDTPCPCRPRIPTPFLGLDMLKTVLA